MHSDHFRAQGRRRVDLPAVLRHETAGWERIARVVDLGLGGACVELGETLEPSAVVTVQIVAPTLWDPLVLHGSVAWTRLPAGRNPARAGVRFRHERTALLYALFELLGAHAYDA